MAAETELFSLPLSPFERYMLADDVPGCPMAYVTRLVCSGGVQRAALERGLATAVARHPLFRARIVGRGTRRAAWVASPEPVPAIDYGPLDRPELFAAGDDLDLAVENGLRLWVREGEGRSVLCMQMHHACADGMGAHQFIVDWLTAYDHFAAGRPGEPQLPPLDPALLRERTRLGLGLWGKLWRFPIHLLGAAGAMAVFALWRPAELPSTATPAGDETLQRLVPRHAVHVFTPTQLKALLARARALRATLNDLLLRDLFLAIYGWNARHQPADARRRVRITVPVNLRDAGHAAMPAANEVGMVFIDRYPTFLARPGPLLWTVCAEMQVVKRLRFGVAFNHYCRLLYEFLGRQKPLTAGTRCLASSLLTNMGRFFQGSPLVGEDGKFRAGGLTVEQIESGPPIRPFMHASFEVFSYAGGLTLSMFYNRFHFTPAAADELLAAYVAQIEQTIATE